MYKSRWPLTGGLLILSSILLFTSEASHAANWRLSENLSLGGIFTDNVRLVEKGKKSRLTGMVAPSILLHGEGRRAKFDLAASLIFNTGSDNPILPRYRALLGTELVKNSLFFNVISRAGQGRINPFAAAGSPVVNQTGNFTTTYVNTLNPYFVSRLNGFADLRINYRYSDLRFSDNAIDPRTQQTLRADLFTNPRSSKISWGLNGYSQKTEYDSDTQADSTRSYVNAVLRYQLNRKWRAAGSVGTESNTFESDTRRETGGSRWYLEARWTPNSRNAFTVRHGGRFFGSYTNLDFYHRARKSVFRLQYRTELRNSSDNLSNQNILPATNLSGQPANPFTNGPFVQPNDFVDLTDNGSYVQDRFRAFYTLTGKRTVLDLVGQYDTRDYLDSSRETIFSRAWVGIQRGLTRRYSVRSRLTWDATEEKGVNNASETWRFLLALTRPVGRKSGLSLSYSYADRRSDSPGNSYKENRVALFFNTNYQGIPGYGFRY